MLLPFVSAGMTKKNGRAPFVNRCQSDEALAVLKPDLKQAGAPPARISRRRHMLIVAVRIPLEILDEEERLQVAELHGDRALVPGGDVARVDGWGRCQSSNP